MLRGLQLTLVYLVLMPLVWEEGLMAQGSDSPSEEACLGATKRAEKVLGHSTNVCKRDDGQCMWQKVEAYLKENPKCAEGIRKMAGGHINRVTSKHRASPKKEADTTKLCQGLIEQAIRTTEPCADVPCYIAILKKLAKDSPACGKPMEVAMIAAARKRGLETHPKKEEKTPRSQIRCQDIYEKALKAVVSCQKIPCYKAELEKFAANASDECRLKIEVAMIKLAREKGIVVNNGDAYDMAQQAKRCTGVMKSVAANLVKCETSQCALDWAEKVVKANPGCMQTIEKALQEARERVSSQ